MADSEALRLELVLASSSPSRRELLSRLGLPFQVLPANIDESRREAEPPRDYVRRLAEAKARAMAGPGRLVVGADQVAALDGTEIFGKPGSRKRAQQQLQALSGREVEFVSGLCLLHPSGRMQLDCVATRVRFRQLSLACIEAYLEQERALGCAASFRSEGLGLCLTEWVRGDDPSALIGLPLVRLTEMLAREGLEPLLTSLPKKPVVS